MKRPNIEYLIDERWKQTPSNHSVEALEAYADYLESENKRLKKFEAYCKRYVHPREWKEGR